MFDPVTIAGATALTEGIKFLFGQVTELLRRHREHAERVAQTADKSSGGLEAAGQPVILPEVPAAMLDGPLAETSVDSTELASAAPQLAKARSSLADYADGVLGVSADDEALRAAMANARGLLETLYRQHLTLAGESGRPATGTPLSPAELSRGQQAIVASGHGAVAADTISGQVVTTGGINIGGNVHGGVHTGGKPE